MWSYKCVSQEVPAENKEIKMNQETIIRSGQLKDRKHEQLHGVANFCCFFSNCKIENEITL